MAEIIIQKCSLALVFNRAFYPFTHPEIEASLRGRGYAVAAPAGLPNGNRVYVSGPIARKEYVNASTAKKESVTVITKEDSKMMAIEGTSIDNVVSSAVEMMKISKENFLLDLDMDLSYLELVADLIVKTDTNPIEAIQRFAGNKFNGFSEIMGEETSSSVINIIPKASLPFQQKWFDIRIEPRATFPQTAYYISVVYRDHITSPVLDFSRQLVSKVNSMLEIITGA